MAEGTAESALRSLRRVWLGLLDALHGPRGASCTSHSHATPSRGPATRPLGRLAHEGEAEAEVAAATRIVAALGGNTGEQPALPSSASSSGDRKRRLTPQNTRAYQAKLKDFYARQGKDMTMPDIAGIVDYYIVRDGHPKKPGSGLQQLRTRLFSEYGCTIGVIRTADEEAALAAKV